jgi:hypothetical protein
MDPKVYGAWVQDHPDLSWHRTDPTDGTFMRVSRVSSGTSRGWVLAWTEKTGGRVRIGCLLAATAYEAMDHADSTIVLSSEVAA